MLLFGYCACDSSCQFVFAFHKNKEYPDLLEKNKGRKEYDRFYEEVAVPYDHKGR